MKRPRFQVRLTEEQQLILGLVLVMLLAISILYCLGFASVVVRQTWGNTPTPWNDTNPPEESLDQPLTPLIEATDAVPMPR